MPKISQYPAQTGASVANGDLFPIVDVGSPNVSEYITADELAQIPQLTSRYKPLASDRIWFAPSELIATFSTLATGTLGNATGDYYRTGAMLFPDSDRIATVTRIVPASWASMDVYLWWSNAGAGSGDVGWRIYYSEFANSESTDVQGSLHLLTSTAPAQYVTKRVKMNGSAISVTSGEMMRLTLGRSASDLTDTLTNAAGVLGIELVRVS